VNNVANDLAISGGAILLGGLGRRVGLDEVAVERTSDKDTEVVLGKFLSPRLFVSYGISVVEAINTIKLRYTINKNWSANIEAGLNQAADLEYKIER
jgi:translocation and assembly module TamB